MTELEFNRDIGSLPNEILINILSLFPTRSLLPLTTTSHRIHDVILRIIHYRLLAAAKVAGHQIVLESYLPSAKHTTPYFVCDFLGTDAVADDELEGVGTLGKLRGMYSHFRPAQPEGDRKVWRVTANGALLPATIDEFTAQKEEYVAQNIDLESYEFFSQLQSVVSLVKLGPRNGCFLSKITVGEGLTRVWRNWLLDRTQCPRSSLTSDEERKNKLLFTSTDEHTGFLFKVIKRNDIAEVMVRSRNEDEIVGYTLQYEELVIRTSQILLSLEQALEQEVRHEGELCGLDGVFLQERYRGRMVDESAEIVWRPVVDAF